jgi:hypothetical protein
MKLDGINCDTAGRLRRPAMLAIALGAVAMGCGSDDYIDPYSDYYAYGYYYPADYAYADPYWVDDYYGYSTFYSAQLKQAGAVGSKTLASSIFELARVESVCPGQVVITPKQVDAPCTLEGSPGKVPSGAAIEFDGCVLPGGGQLDGSLNIDSSRTFSDDTCDAATVVSVSYTSISTDLSYTAPSGTRVVASSLSRSGSYTRLLMAAPSALSISTSGRLEHFAKDGSLVAQLGSSGTQSVVINGSADAAGYRLDGALTVHDTLKGEALTVTGSDLTRTEACCRPSGGTLTITGSGRDTDVWSFGPRCGDLELNGNSVTLSECF